MRVRFISRRSPYRRGGLLFDRTCRRTAAGHALIELTRDQYVALGEANARSLLTDPNITYEMVIEKGELEPASSPVADEATDLAGAEDADPASKAEGDPPAEATPANYTPAPRRRGSSKSAASKAG
ncbi:MAG TPA: hypothetical protein VMU59_11470 [Caulobacteraceae bacterium]|nr:hypothetical protein [Caulobacteraceae bacterium]